MLQFPKRQLFCTDKKDMTTFISDYLKNVAFFVICMGMLSFTRNLNPKISTKKL